MKVTVMETPLEIGAAVGKIFTDAVKENPNCVLGLATGSSPLPTYAEMIRAYRDGEISFKNVTTFNLDEYCDLPKEDKNSYYSFMFDNLFSGTDINPESVHFLDGNAADDKAECAAYEELIEKAGGIDVQLLGIGNNGHIGFNEPADEFTKHPYKVKLTQSTLDANKRFFPDSDMPLYALTMGIENIMNAKKIVLIATGEAKADAVYKMIKGEVSPSCPASVLQNHGDVLIFLDKAAAAKL